MRMSRSGVSCILSRGRRQMLELCVHDAVIAPSPIYLPLYLPTEANAVHTHIPRHLTQVYISFYCVRPPLSEHRGETDIVSKQLRRRLSPNDSSACDRERCPSFPKLNLTTTRRKVWLRRRIKLLHFLPYFPCFNISPVSIFFLFHIFPLLICFRIYLLGRKRRVWYWWVLGIFNLTLLTEFNLFCHILPDYEYEKWNSEITQ